MMDTSVMRHFLDCGATNAWTHSEKERVIERFSRPSKNYLSY
jgi:hypothetical protein